MSLASPLPAPRVLMVVGAGRGPLVRRALAAAKAAKRMIKVYAVEKNPNAVVTLQAQQDEDWGEQVLLLAHSRLSLVCQ